MSIKLSKTYEDFYSYIYRLIHVEKKEIIGTGLFSAVFANNDTVVKVFTAEDTAYLYFIKFCLKNKSNPFLPTLISVQGYYLTNVHSPAYYIVVLKKYTHLLNPSYPCKELRSKLSPSIPNKYINGIKKAEKLLKEVSCLNKDLNKVMKFITEIPSNLSVDLHGWNIMYDESNNLVFSDPLSPKEVSYEFKSVTEYVSELTMIT